MGHVCYRVRRESDISAGSFLIEREHRVDGLVVTEYRFAVACFIFAVAVLAAMSGVLVAAHLEIGPWEDLGASDLLQLDFPGKYASL